MPKSILIVEHQPTQLDYLHSILTEMGHHLTTAMEGETASQLLLENHFDALITPVMLPYVDGIQLVKQIRFQEPPYTWIGLATAYAHDSLDQLLQHPDQPDKWLKLPYDRQEIESLTFEPNTTGSQTP